MIEPKGRFSLYQFDGSTKYVVQFKNGRFTRYFCREVKPYKEALFYFWRKLGAM